MDDYSDAERGGAKRKGSAGLVFVTISALVMAIMMVALPIWLGGPGRSLEMDVWRTFYADLHPILLHIPIGVFVLILVMELCGILSFGKWRPQTTFPLFVGVVGAVLAAIAGNFMHLRMTESDGVGFNHIWGFTVFVVLAILTFVTKIWANHSGAKSPIYGILLVLTIGAMSFTGAQGGVLGWKEPFRAPLAQLFGGGATTETVQAAAPAGKGAAAKPANTPKKAEPPKKAESPKKADPPKPEEAPSAPVADKPAGQPVAKPAAAGTVKAVPDRLAYDDVIVPILQGKCYECHADADQNPLGKKKIKGSLVLTSIEDMEEGGSEAEALVPGDLENSLMHVRIHLPMDDDEHMPPEDKDQLDAHEVAIIDWWIKAGAPTVSLKEAKAGPEILAAVGNLAAPGAQQAKRAAAAAAAAEAKVAAEKKRKSLETAMAAASREFPNALTFVSRESSDLQFTAVSMRQDFTDEKLAKLETVSSGLVEVNLGATSVTDGGLSHLAGMPNLRKLHLQQTKVTDAGLETVGKLKNLEWLNLFGTDVTDAGLKRLEGLPKLKKVYLWGTKVTPDGAKAFRGKLPDCEVNLGTDS